MPTNSKNDLHPQVALAAYARDMHQYTLDLWMQLSRKLEASGTPAAKRPHVDDVPYRRDIPRFPGDGTVGGEVGEKDKDVDGEAEEGSSSSSPEGR